MTDLLGARVLEVVPDRDGAGGEKLWSAAKRRRVDRAAIHDKFHASQMPNEAVDKTGREAARALQEKHRGTLKGTHYRWLHGRGTGGAIGIPM